MAKPTVAKLQAELNKLIKQDIIDDTKLPKNVDEALVEFDAIANGIDSKRVAGKSKLEIYNKVVDFYNENVFPHLPAKDAPAEEAPEEEAPAEEEAPPTAAKTMKKAAAKPAKPAAAAKTARGELIDLPVLGEIKPFRKSSNQAKWAEILARKAGATEAQMREVCDRDVRSGIIKYDIHVPHGYGVKEVAGKGGKPNTFHLVFPEGETKVQYK